jgi:hypothetical protein
MKIHMIFAEKGWHSPLYSSPRAIPRAIPSSFEGELSGHILIISEVLLG